MVNVQVCVFAKPPRPGVVKTRLARALGPDAAAMLAAAFFRDTWRLVNRLPWAEPIAAVTEDPGLAFGVPLHARTWPQGEGDLGERLERVFRRALRRLPAIALGADTPGLPVSLLEAAHAALLHADAVVGPADDGGFYLVGLKRCPPGLLGGVPWSRDDTCSVTLARLRDSGLEVAVLEPWFDVDELGDLLRLEQLVLTGKVEAEDTRAVLRELRALAVLPRPITSGDST